MRRNALLGNFLLAAGMLLPMAAVNAADSALPPQFVIYGKSISAVPMAEWEAQGKMNIATGKGQIAKAPKSAVKYMVKSVHWPSGTVRVLTFTKAGVLHAISDETEIFVLKGSVTVDVAGTPTVLNAGDVAAHVTGVVHSGAPAADTTLVTWTVGSLNQDALKPTVVRAAAAPETGQPDVLKVKRYDFPGNSIRVATMIKGSKNGPASAKTDSLIYLKEGHVRFYEGNEVHELRAGDFAWEEAGQTHRWEHVDGGSFVTTSGLPKNAAPINPADATDSAGKK